MDLQVHKFPPEGLHEVSPDEFLLGELPVEPKIRRRQLPLKAFNRDQSLNERMNIPDMSIAELKERFKSLDPRTAKAKAKTQKALKEKKMKNIDLCWQFILRGVCTRNNCRRAHFCREGEYHPRGCVLHIVMPCEHLCQGATNAAYEYLQWQEDNHDPEWPRQPCPPVFREKKRPRKVPTAKSLPVEKVKPSTVTPATQTVPVEEVKSEVKHPTVTTAPVEGVKSEVIIYLPPTVTTVTVPVEEVKSEVKYPTVATVPAAVAEVKSEAKSEVKSEVKSELKPSTVTPSSPVPETAVKFPIVPPLPVFEVEPPTEPPPVPTVRSITVPDGDTRVHINPIAIQLLLLMLHVAFTFF